MDCLTLYFNLIVLRSCCPTLAAACVGLVMVFVDPAPYMQDADKIASYGPMATRFPFIGNASPASAMSDGNVLCSDSFAGSCPLSGTAMCIRPEQ